MDMMKAVVLYGKDDLRYEDYPMPKLKQGSVKVRVRAAGICGSDIPRVLGDAAFFYPIVLGHEFAGDVVEIAPDVTTIKVGDRISGAAHIPCYKCDDCARGDYGLCKNYSFIGSREQGAFSFYVVMPEQNAVKYDESISYEQAVLFEPCTVAIHGLRVVDFQGSKDVAILGGGTVGLFASQYAKIMGAKSVTVFDIDQDRLALAADLGADHVINTSDTDFMKQAMELTGGKGYEYIFETAGQPATMQMMFALSSGKGIISLIGYPAVPVTFDANLWENLNRKELTMVGSRMSYTPPFPGPDWTLTAHYFANNQIKRDKRMIDRKFDMRHAREAFNLFREPKNVKGKILLVNDLPL